MVVSSLIKPVAKFHLNKKHLFTREFIRKTSLEDLVNWESG